MQAQSRCATVRISQRPSKSRRARGVGRSSLAPLVQPLRLGSRRGLSDVANRAATPAEPLGAKHSKVRTGRKFDRQLPDSWSKVCAGRKFEVAAPYEKLGTSSSLAIRLPISRDAVAAGEGALSTWTWRGARS